MSDDEEIAYIKRQKIVHYGSLEEQERLRLAAEKEKDEAKVDDASDDDDDDDDDDEQTELSEGVKAAIAAGNINMSEEYMEMEEHVSHEKQLLLEEFERRKKARQINVSTDDAEVKGLLRQLAEPICLFGEGPADRRERLRQILARLGEDALKKNKDEQKEREDKEQTEITWYHEGEEPLINSRYWIAAYSLPRARDRLKRAMEEKVSSQSQKQAKKQELYKQLRCMTIHSSQIGDIRPLSFCHFSPDAKILATSSWSGMCKLWSVPDCKLLQTYRAHNCNVGAMVFHPLATLTQSESACNLASCATDGSVKLWSLLNDQPLANLQGHAPFRVSRLAFHPSGKYMATCVFDNSWRLWDVEKCVEILHQEGHSKPVYDACFQCDGSLLATGGKDGFGRIWDLRTGRCIMFMEGHLKSILTVDISPNGYSVASGSEDNTIKMWDIRQQKCEYTIPAHTNLVSRVIFEKSLGRYLISSSYDSSLKIWAHPGWNPIQTLSGHDGKIMGADISPSGPCIATSSYDRTFKLWAPEP